MNNFSVPLPPPERPTDVRSLRIALPLLTVSWLLLASIIVMAAVRIQRWELAPGEASAVAPLVEFAPIKGGEPVPTRYRAENGINFVTAFGGQLSVLDTLVGWLDPHVVVHTYKEHFGEQTPTDSRRLGFQAMVGAKQIADYVAMKRLGLDVALVEGKILVPFAIESSLSGVQKSVGDQNELWYNREFTVPATWKNKKVMLNFGAVDWKADVWINDIQIGSHKGGYTPFSFDITPYLLTGKPQKLIVRVWDPTNKGFQPRGKQVVNPGGIWYTAVTGIWQTEWIEPVGENHLNQLK